MIIRTPRGLKQADLSRVGRRQLLGGLALGGAGALLGLPFFESLFGGSEAQADDPAPKRLIAFYVPCGINMVDFTPKKQGFAYDLRPILSPLEMIRPKVSVITGLANNPAFPDGAGDHASGTGAFLTVAHPKKTEAADIQDGISVDQVAANAFKSKTAIESMQLGIDGGGGVGNCDSGYSCAYAHNISWSSPTQPLQCLTSPSLVWDQLFSGADPTQTSKEKARQLLYRTSILDYVKDDTTTLRGKLGQTDQKKLDQYLDGVADLEAKIQKSTQGPMCVAIPKPVDGGTVEQHVDIMTDLMTLAFQCDATRVISFMLANAGSNREYPFLNGVTGGHHENSHHGGDPVKLANLTKIGTWEIMQFASLCAKLDAVTDVNGKTILDNSLVYLGSEIEDGNTHYHRNMPILLAGSAGGAITPGQHLVYDESVSVAQLYITMLNALGVPTKSFGDATSPLAKL